VHEVGAEDCGPNTLNAIVPDGEEPEDKFPDTDEAAIALPAVPDDGADTDRPGLAELDPNTYAAPRLELLPIFAAEPATAVAPSPDTATERPRASPAAPSEAVSFACVGVALPQPPAGLVNR
jgi:hypothetical protein